MHCKDNRFQPCDRLCPDCIRYEPELDTMEEEIAEERFHGELLRTEMEELVREEMRAEMEADLSADMDAAIQAEMDADFASEQESEARADMEAEDYFCERDNMLDNCYD